jgi:hypothetical protein
LPFSKSTDSPTNTSNGTPNMTRSLTINGSPTSNVSNPGRLRPLPLPPTPPPPLTPPPPPSLSPSHASSGRRSGAARPLPRLPTTPTRPAAGHEPFGQKRLGAVRLCMHTRASSLIYLFLR